MNLSVIGIVLQNKEIISGVYDMHIRCEGIAGVQPGQFVNILCEGGDALLRRPISICDVFGDTLRIIYEVRGRGTALLAGYAPGRRADLLAPLGQGFVPDRDAKNPVLVGGGIGVYPLLMLAKQLRNPQVFLGFRSKERVTLAEEFAAVSTLRLATDDGSEGHHGLVTETAADYIAQNGTDVIYACGPKPMLKAVKAMTERFHVKGQLSMEERMGCGIGACLVCACKTKAEDGDFRYAHVCKDGPVFDAAEVIFE